uniref:Integrase catalytic domain-containing protein n=1 Tax=Romanomermis culicivorax TaxID=13658 RepID=A0A915IIX9_ROMCU
LCNTQKVHKTPYHPIANGEVERCNQTLAARIGMCPTKSPGRKTILFNVETITTSYATRLIGCGHRITVAFDLVQLQTVFVAMSLVAISANGTVQRRLVLPAMTIEISTRTMTAPAVPKRILPADFVTLVTVVSLAVTFHGGEVRQNYY